ncbi:hypothetical protein E4U32_005921 [Claviceps aff. humidiphila group G2b]|nr:hypothetical protein E4U32_005921 [Claviceps aff. humidiphila group G2b]
MAEEWAQKAAAAWADGFTTLRVGTADSSIQAKIGEGFWDPDALEDILRYVEEEKSRAYWVENYGAFWQVVLGDDHEHPSVTKCKISVKQVKSWKKKWLHAEPGEQSAPQKGDRHAEDDDNFCIRALDALIAPLQRQSKPGDLLFLLPTGILRSIPLHALWLPSRMLLRSEIQSCTETASRHSGNAVGTRAKRMTMEVCRLLRCDRDREWAFAGVYEGKRGRTCYADEQTETYVLVHFQDGRRYQFIVGHWEQSEKTWVRNALERSSLLLFLGSLNLGTFQRVSLGYRDDESVSLGGSRVGGDENLGDLAASRDRFASEMYGDMVEERRRCCREPAVVDVRSEEPRGDEAAVSLGGLCAARVLGQYSLSDDGRLDGFISFFFFF